MSALSTIHPTLIDFVSTLGPDHKVSKIVEILNETNEVIQDFVTIEANQPASHKTTVRTGIPEPTWRKLYGGVQPTKGGYAQVTDNIGMMEAYAEVDKALADLNGNTAAFRLVEDRGHIEGMNQEFASTLFYGNESTEPEAFTGLAPRFNSTSADNGDNVIKAGGNSTDNQSIWLIGWGADTVHGIYPKGSQGGIQMQDKGQVTIENVDGNGGRMEAYRSHYRWDAGVSVRDWRYVVRICNITDTMVGSGSAAKALIELLIQAIERIPNPGTGRLAFYCSRGARTALRLGVLDKVASNLTFESVAGKRFISFDGIPVRRVDALHNGESLVS